MKTPPVDYFCTPKDLAHKMMRAVQSTTPKCVADFAAGDGTLLRTAEEYWKDCRIVALDLRRAAVKRLTTTHPQWQVARCDFLSELSRSRCRVLQAQGFCDLVLLNPPFSSRGNAYWTAITESGAFVRCSRALAFVLTSLTYLGRQGRLVAVLPRGCLTSEKDTAAWSAILRHYDRKVIALNGRKAFARCAASTAIVRLTRRKMPRAMAEQNGAAAVFREPLVLVRGRVQMHSVNGKTFRDGYSLVHTTNLRQFKLAATPRRVGPGSKPIVGPAVLLPRVGRPDLLKVVVVPRGQALVMSDCVISLCCGTEQRAKRLYKDIILNWINLERLYGGTGAPYVTLRTIKHFLHSLGYGVSVQSLNGLAK